MNFTITLPKRKKPLTLAQWMRKCRVSTNHCSLNIGIKRAQEHLKNE